MFSQGVMDQALSVGSYLSQGGLKFKFDAVDNNGVNQFNRDFVVVLSLGGDAELTINEVNYRIPFFGFAFFLGINNYKLLKSNGGGDFIQIMLPYSLVSQIVQDDASHKKIHAGEPLVDRCSIEYFSQFLKHSKCYLESNDARMHGILQEEFVVFLRRLLYSRNDSVEVVVGASSPRVHKKYVQRILEYIHEHYQQKIQVSDIANAIGLEASYSRKLFKQQLGVAVMDYVKMLRLNHACYLLQETQEDVTGIAFDSGFTSITRFYEVFSQEMAMSPLCFRKKIGEVADGVIA